MADSVVSPRPNSAKYRKVNMADTEAGVSRGQVPPRMENKYDETQPHQSELIEVIATVASVVFLVITFPISVFYCFKVVQEYERAVIFRLGRLRAGNARGPGIFFIIPCIDNYIKVDLRTVSFDVPPQEVLTKDHVTVSVDAVVYYAIQNPLHAVVNVADYSHSTRLLAATTLRNVLGTRNLAEILSDRAAITHTMQTLLDVATDPWGIKVERVEIKDVRLPQQLQRAMAAEAEAAREARAKVIAAEGEMKASRALKEASDVIVESPAALQLRYLQTLSTIATEKNSTIVFPLPIDLLAAFMPDFRKNVGKQLSLPSKALLPIDQIQNHPTDLSDQSDSTPRSSDQSNSTPRSPRPPTRPPSRPPFRPNIAKQKKCGEIS